MVLSVLARDLLIERFLDVLSTHSWISKNNVLSKGIQVLEKECSKWMFASISCFNASSWRSPLSSPTHESSDCMFQSEATH